MNKALIIVLSALLTPATALAWRYVVLESEEVVYDGAIPPMDLSYPPLGESTPVMQAGELQEGEILTSAQLAERRLQPHVIIVPSKLTQGGTASSQVTTGAETSIPMAAGSSSF